jgi:7,8-dihydropterin-6-yl-methyl-4-(beta-D-ribofuranosyl)aminobenzene 5'-phosphate synthase
LLEGAEKTILFDTGADGSTLLSNMNKLGIDITNIDTLVLSHSHTDHAGGLLDFLKHNHQVTVYALASFPNNFKEHIKQTGASLIEVDKSKEICPNIFTTGELGLGIKEQALVLNTAKGLIVVTGCAHPGIVEITGQVKKLINQNVLFIIGGFHLFSTSEKGIENIISDLENLGVANVAPCHCSGDQARQMFKNVFQEHYLDVGVGRVITIADLK